MRIRPSTPFTCLALALAGLLPFHPLAYASDQPASYQGQWVATLIFTTEPMSRSPSKVADMRAWGSISPEGFISLDTDAGCSLQGLLIPLGTNLQGPVTATGCDDPLLDRTYAVYLFGAPLINFRGSDRQFISSSSYIKYSVRGVLTRR